MADILHPDRHLELEGAHNVRDLGGYRMQDGRQTRWKRFLRADNLHQLTSASQDALIEYGVRTVIDLRRTQETIDTPNVFADSSRVAYHHHNMIGDTPLPGVPEEGEATRRIADTYCIFLDDCKDQTGEILATLAAPGALPALYHCASGKDRTGLISALILGLAGVPEETIAQDYGLSARYLVGRESLPSISTWEDFQREYCPPDTMLITLQHLEQSYGGVEGYMRSIGLQEEQIDSLRTAIVE